MQVTIQSFCLELAGPCIRGPLDFVLLTHPIATPLVQCTSRVLVPCIFYPAPDGERSIVMSLSVCLSVCVCLSVRYRILGTTRPIFSNFYRAMLCIRGPSHGPVSVCVCVCPSVRLSQVGVLLKRINGGSHKQNHTISQRL